MIEGIVAPPRDERLIDTLTAEAYYDWTKDAPTQDSTNANVDPGYLQVAQNALSQIGDDAP